MSTGSDDHVAFPPAPASGPNDELKKLLLFKAYKRRWLLLLVVCLLNCSNATLWLSFAPVADQSAQYLKATLGEINWLSVVYMVVSIPLSVVSTWMLDTIGLRITLILGSWLNMFGAVVRIMGVPGQYLRIDYATVMVGQTISAVAQPLVIFTPTKMAALWFPDHQRATANMMASMANPLGILLANVVSPAVARTPDRIPVLMLVYSIPTCLICFLATVFIRSSAPPTPPSASAEHSTSEPFLQGVKLLLKNRAYLVLLVCFGSGVGVFTCFSTLLDQILCVQGYTNDFAGLCAALFIVFGIGGAALLGRYVDKTKRFTEAVKINMAFSALAGVSDAAAERCCGGRVLALRLLRVFHLPGGHGAVRGMLLPCGRGHLGRTHLHIGTNPVHRLHRPAPVVSHARRRVAALHLRARPSKLEGVHDGAGNADRRLHLRLHRGLPHALQTPGGRRGRHLRAQTGQRLRRPRAGQCGLVIRTDGTTKKTTF
ncbi:solute carrier family 49 member A3 isoform X1 [Syngnathoides biaculeatus]|uniref:solute carrier family 49 member A3 isoform X1 n=1 Tax=Syngnathoides biaculeatus TaxID=300417 RepID=UPI002ADE8EC3|nr:solute carrier family 49 member A3 isoform X1 [Syngnathoides biaculeatus]